MLNPAKPTSLPIAAATDSPQGSLEQQPDKVTEVAQATLEETMGTLHVLPVNVLWRVVKMLDLPDLKHFGLCSSFWEGTVNDDLVWKLIAEEIGCPLQGDLPVKDQVKELYGLLVKSVKARNELDSLRPLLNDITSPNIAKIRLMRDLTIAIDIIALWGRLVMTLDPNANPIDLFGIGPPETWTSEQIIEKANQFDDWFTAHHNELSLLTALELQMGNLIHLPQQLCKLTGLQNLDLGNNLFSRFPSELCALPELTHLEFGKNPLKPGPGPLKLPPKLVVHKGFADKLPFEIDLQIAAQLGFPASCMRTLGMRTKQYFSVEMARIEKRDLPEDILNLVHNQDHLTVDQVRFLIQWRKASDTLHTWRALAMRLNKKATDSEIYGVEREGTRTAKSDIDLATQFPKWFTAHEERLASLPSLEFGDHHLELPVQLGSPALLGKLICRSDRIEQGEIGELITSYIDSPIQDLKYFLSRIEATNYFRKGGPADIYPSYHDKSLNEIKKFLLWLKARNTLDIWLKLGRLIGQDEETTLKIFGVPNTHFNNSQAEIELAAHFDAWFEAHREELMQLESLDLSNMNLISLPKGIGELTRLKSLDLSENGFVTIPKEICTLLQLENLSLSELGEIPAEFPKFAALKKLCIPIKHPYTLELNKELQKLNLYPEGPLGLFYFKRSAEERKILDVRVLDYSLEQINQRPNWDLQNRIYQLTARAIARVVLAYMIYRIASHILF